MNSLRLTVLSAIPKIETKEIKTNSEFRKTIVGVALFITFLFLLYLVQFSTPNLPGNDGYYHIRFAALMRTEGLKPDFPWLPLTILNAREFYDHHFLYHVALIPFTFGDLIQGAKWASIFFSSLTFLSIWWLLKNQHVPYSAIWALGLMAISEAFIYRMSMPRAQSLSLAILVLGLNFLLLGKYKYLLPLSFLYVWLYDAFPLILVVTGVYVVTICLVEGRFDFRPFYYALAGVILGLLINPYFPHNLVFSVRHILPKLLDPAAVRVGNEWYPYDTGQLLENSPLALLFFVSGIIALGLRGQRMDTRTATTLFLSIVFGFLLFQSRRFIEYFPPFALIFAGLAWSPLISKRSDQIKNTMDTGDRKALIPRSNRLKGRISVWLTPAVLVVILAVGMWFTLRNAQTSLQDSKSATRYAEASSWLHQNTPHGALIFQTDWDDFPRLFFHNTWNTYLVGLDPTYLHTKDSQLYDLWVDITKGKVRQPSQAIYDNFYAKFVLTDLLHKDFIKQAENDTSLEEVFRDEEAIIYRVASTGGE
jgi:hypothetical protein